MKQTLFKKSLCLLLAVSCLLALFPVTLGAASAKPRPSTAGQLHVEGTQLLSENGEIVQLTGISTHGLTYYPEFINEELFSQLSSEWNCNLIRLPMYSDVYCSNLKEKVSNLRLVQQGIEAALANDLYVLVDWHILKDNDPNENIEEAILFFDELSGQYANCPNILYEICNEPNGDTTWEDIKRYAEQVIPVIRKNSPDAIIIVGTPNYDTDLLSPLEHPITEYSNILYTYHFYANSHREENRAVLTDALQGGLPVFVTECGFVDADGDSDLNYEETEKWLTLLNEYHISYAVWNLSNKYESSAMVKNTTTKVKHLKDSDLTPCGQYVKALLQGKELSSIPADIITKKTFSELWKGSFFFSFGIIAAGTLLLLLLFWLIRNGYRRKSPCSYDVLLKKTGDNYIPPKDKKHLFGKLFLVLSIFTTIVYLTWRISFSLPLRYGVLPTLCSLLLLAVELFGFMESCIHYAGMIRLRDYPLPEIQAEEYPDVDIFVATYNEPTELLRKTLIGCKKMRYPDQSKVHIYLCDDKRRPEMQELAEELGVNYFKRANNIGAKAGNLNAAMERTSSPYVVTFDADMIPREEFLLKTIPYFVDAEKRNQTLPEKERMPLGLLQTPQCFYNPDVFQHNLYAEKRIPNEQDFFYRTIEAAKTTSNSVIYGGSNTILSRQAIEDIGGFYTGSITEDFATGLLIEAKGYISLGLSEPLASGLAPTTFAEHIQQRTRWGRGVILTAKKLKIGRNKNLTLSQKLSYLSSVFYWYSSVKNWIYILSPLLFAVLGIPVLLCSWQQIFFYWIPMFLFQTLTLRFISKESLSTKRSGIQETVVMPFLFFPVLKETFGISLTTFKVTDKKGSSGKRQRSFKSILPFLLLILLSLFGIVRILLLLTQHGGVGLAAVLFWLIRNLYFLLMCLFLLDGRDGNGENVIVTDAEDVTVTRNGYTYTGITTQLTEHSLTVFTDEDSHIQLGQPVTLTLNELPLSGAVVGIKQSPNRKVPKVYTIEILDFHGQQDEYLHLLYNRIPTLPQNLHRDLGLITDLWVNLIKHLGAQTRY